VSATQPVRFLDLIWTTLMGCLVFGDVRTSSTLLGGLVIFAATTWVARWSGNTSYSPDRDTARRTGMTRRGKDRMDRCRSGGICHQANAIAPTSSFLECDL
jgi:drug/metabolite transporter (DMT)-like permease